MHFLRIIIIPHDAFVKTFVLFLMPSYNFGRKGFRGLIPVEKGRGCERRYAILSRAH